MFSRLAHAVLRVEDGFMQRVERIGGIVCYIELVLLALEVRSRYRSSY